MNDLRLYLASASPRRRTLLLELGIEAVTIPPGLDERPLPGEPPPKLVLRLAEAKGRAVAARLQRSDEPGVILAADTAVVIDDRALGKPADAREAVAMLRLLRGRTHEVLTGVFLLRTEDGRNTTGLESTRVHFRAYDDATIRDYVAGGGPLDKAGAYGIQDDGARLAEGLDGSWSNVVGLPLERLPEWLRRIGVELCQLARPDSPDPG